MSIQQFEFSKTWRDKSAFPTYQTSEAQVREDLQCLHDEMADYVNNTLVPAINAGSSGGGSSASVSAGDVAFNRTDGVPEDNVQDAIENVQGQLASISQGAVADGSITTAKLANGAVTAEKLASGAIGWRKLTASEFGLTTDTGVKTIEDSAAYYCAALGIVRFQAKITVVARTASSAIYDLYFDSTKYYKPTPGDDFYLNGVVNAKCYAKQVSGSLEGEDAVRAMVFEDVTEDSLISVSGFYYTEDIPAS